MYLLQGGISFLMVRSKFLSTEYLVLTTPQLLNKLTTRASYI